MFTMKRGSLLVVLGLLFVVSYSACKKGNTGYSGPDNGCISRVQPASTDHLLSSGALDSIHTLFQENNLSEAGLQFYLYQSTTYADSAGLRKDTAYANLFVNGLPAFYTWRSFPFRNRLLQPREPWNEGSPGFPTNHNDTTGHQTLANLRGAFLRLTTKFSAGYPSTSYPVFGDSCLVATLGYIDASNLPGSTYLAQQLLVKVWVVTTPYVPVPVVIVIDSSGAASMLPWFSINV